MGASKFLRCSESGLGVQVFRHDCPIAYPEHKHSEIAIVICTGGTIESTQFSCREMLYEDQVLLTNSGISHASRYGVDVGFSQGVTVEFSPAVLERLGYPRSSAYLQSLFLGKLHMPSASRLARMIEDEVAKPDQNSSLMVTALARQIIFTVLREWPDTLIRGCKVEGGGNLPRRELVRSIEIMNVTPIKDFSVPELSRQLNRSVSTFSRLFTQSVGDSPNSFFRNLILQQASNLLSTSDRSIKDIALTLGFANVSHFSSSFRMRWAVTPTEFRRNMRNPHFGGEGSNTNIEMLSDKNVLYQFRSISKQ